MEPDTLTGARLVVQPFRAVHLAESMIGAPVANRAFARPYRAVPGRLRDWRRKRQVRVDETPALYVHEYTAAGVTVRGLVANLELGPAAGAVHAHEAVHPAQVAQLARRMSDMRLNPAPILLTFQAPDALRAALSGVVAREPDHVFSDRADQRHRLWKLTEDDAARVSALLEGCTALIADGHHRYAAAEQLRAQRPGTGWDRTLVMLIDQGDNPMQLCAIHRTVLGVDLPRIEAAAVQHGDRFVTRRDQHEALTYLDRALVLHDGIQWATLETRPVPADVPLVCTLHDRLLDQWGAREAQLEYHHTAGDAIARAAQGVSVLLPAPTYDQVLTIASAGSVLPPKATSFQPKPHVGVLMRALRDG